MIPALPAQPYRVIGSSLSPYSVKLRAVLRYRRLPHIWLERTAARLAEIRHIRPAIVPVLQFPEDGSYHADSTPLIYALDARHPEARRVVPEDPGLAFLAHLLEDMADEWGTKILFLYRWGSEPDRSFVSRCLARELLGPAGEERLRETAAAIAKRQTERMSLVGCTEENGPIIEESFTHLLTLFESHLEHCEYFFGTRPSLADFGWYGQLMQLACDPTPHWIMRDTAPETLGWTKRLDDASGIEGDWPPPEAPLGAGVRHLLCCVGELYLPFLCANHKAITAGRADFTLTLFGRPYRQSASSYQAKCLDWLRQEFAALSDEARERIAPALKESGCWEALVPV